MGEVLRPERLESDPNLRSVASKEWNHWKITFDNIVAAPSIFRSMP